MQVYGKEEIAEVANLINDFMSEDVDKRINSAHNLRRIADTLGTDRVKKELIPFLKECNKLMSQRSTTMTIK